MTDYYWTGAVSTDATDMTNWMHFVGPTPTSASSTPGVGDNLAFADLSGSGIGGPHAAYCIINAPMSVNNVRVYASPGVGAPTEILPNGLPAAGWDQIGFTLEFNAVLTCENFAMCTYDTPSAPIGLHNGAYDKDMYAGLTVRLLANATAWPYLGTNVSYLNCTNSFYFNGGEVENCAVRCNGYYVKGEGNHGYLGNCILEQNGGFHTVERMRGGLSGMRVSGITIDNGSDPAGLTGGNYTFNPDPASKHMQVNSIQIMGNVTVSSHTVESLPIWFINGVNPYIDSSVTENQGHLYRQSGPITLTHPVFTAPFGTLTVEASDCDFGSATFTGYGNISANESELASTSTSYHEIGTISVMSGAGEYGLINVKVAERFMVNSPVSAAWNTGPTELYVDHNLAPYTMNMVDANLTYSGSPAIIDVINCHGSDVQLRNSNSELLTIHAGSTVSGTGSNTVHDKLTYSGTDLIGYFTISRASSGTGYEATTTHTSTPNLKIMPTTSSITTTMSGGATLSTNPIHLEIGDSFLDGAKNPHNVSLVGINIRALTHSPCFSASVWDRDRIYSDGAVYFTEPATYNITVQSNPASGNVLTYPVKLEMHLGTSGHPGPVVQTADFSIPGDVGTKLIVGGSATPMQHLGLALLPSTNPSLLSQIEVHSTAHNQVCATGESLVVGALNIISKEHQHDDTIWELTSASTTDPAAHTTAASYKAAIGQLSCELADNCQYGSPSGPDMYGRNRFWDLVFRFANNTGASSFCSYYANPTNIDNIPGFMFTGNASLAIECVTNKQYTQAHYPLNGNLYQWGMAHTNPMRITQRGNVTNAAFIAQGAGALNTVGNNVGQYIEIDTYMDNTTSASASFNLAAFNTVNITTTANWTLNILLDFDITTFSATGPGSVTWDGSTSSITHVRNFTLNGPQIWNTPITVNHDPNSSTIYGWSLTNGAWTGTDRPTFNSQSFGASEQTLWATDQSIIPNCPIITLEQGAKIQTNSSEVECYYMHATTSGGCIVNTERPNGQLTNVFFRRGSGLVDHHVTWSGAGALFLEPFENSATGLNLHNSAYSQQVNVGYSAATVSTGDPAALILTQDIAFTSALVLNRTSIINSVGTACVAEMTGAYHATVTNLYINVNTSVRIADLTLNDFAQVQQNSANSLNEIDCTGTLTLVANNSNFTMNATNTVISAATRIRALGTASYSTIAITVFTFTTASTNVGHDAQAGVLGNSHATTFTINGTLTTGNLTIGDTSTLSATQTWLQTGLYTDYNQTIISSPVHNGKTYELRGSYLGSVSMFGTTTFVASFPTGIRMGYLSMLAGSYFSATGAASTSVQIEGTANLLGNIAGEFNYPGPVGSDGRDHTIYINNATATNPATGAVIITSTGVVQIGLAANNMNALFRARDEVFRVDSGATLKIRASVIDNASVDANSFAIDAVAGACTVEIDNCEIATTSKWIETHNLVSGFFIYSRVSASSTASSGLITIGHDQGAVCTSFSMYGITSVQDSVGSYFAYMRCIPDWRNFRNNRVVTPSGQAILMSNGRPTDLSPAFSPKNWVFEGTATPLRTLVANDTYTHGWSMPLSTSNYGAVEFMDYGNSMALNVNGLPNVFIGGDNSVNSAGSIETSVYSASSRLKPSLTTGEFIHSGGKTYYHNPSATALYKLDTDSIVSRTGTVIKVTWEELNPSHVATFDVHMQTPSGSYTYSLANANGASVAIPSTALTFYIRVNIPNDQCGITNFQVIDTAYSNAVIYHERFDHALASGDNYENATLSSTNFALRGFKAPTASSAIPDTLPPLCSKELKPKNPTYLFTPDKADILNEKQYVLQFGHQDNSNYYVAQWTVDNPATTMTAKLWVIDNGVATDLIPSGLTVPIDATDARCQFGIKWSPGVAIQFVTRYDVVAVETDVGAPIANTAYSNGQFGFGSRQCNIIAFDVIERSGLTLRGQNIIFQSGVYWGDIVNGVDLYDCTVNTNLLGAFPTYDTDPDDSVFELTSFLTDDFPARIENFCQVLKGTVSLSSDIVLSGVGKLHLFGCIVKRADGGRWKIDTTGITYNNEPPCVLDSCQLRGIQSTVKVLGKALIVLDDESKNAYITKIYARKEMRVKRNRVLGLAFNRNITNGFDNYEQDCSMIVHNDMSIPGELDYMWKNEKVFEFITPYSYQWKAKLTAYRVDIKDSSNVTSAVRFTVEEWRTD